MHELTGQPIMTNIGRQRMLTGLFAVESVAFGDASWHPTADSEALQNSVSVVPASVTVEPMEGGNYRLRVTGVDRSPASYALHEFALLDSTGAALAIYSQGSAIDAKQADSELEFRADIVIVDHLDYILVGEVVAESHAPRATRWYLDPEGRIMVTFNAKWSGPQWEKDSDALDAATRFMIAPEEGLTRFQHAPGTATFSDSSWQDGASIAMAPLVEPELGVPGRLYGRNTAAALAKVRTGSLARIEWSHNIESPPSIMENRIDLSLTNPIADFEKAVVITGCEDVSVNTSGSVFANNSVRVIAQRTDGAKPNLATEGFVFHVAIYAQT